MEETSGHFEPFMASLNFVSHLPLDHIEYLETDTHLYLVCTNRLKKDFRLVKVMKDDNALDYFMDNRIYTKDEIQIDLGHLKMDKKNVNTGKAKAIIGFVRFTRGYYIIFVTKRRHVATIGPHRMYEVRDTTMISLCESNPTQKYRQADEERYLLLFKSFDLKQSFFYSHSYDLTNTLQTNMTHKGQYQMREKFVWNQHLLAPMSVANATMAMTTSFALAPGSSDPLHMLDWAPWAIHLIRGSIVSSVMGQSIHVVLIGRWSKNFAGPRLKKRGVNAHGHVANHVEIEQIVFDSASLRNYETVGNFTSYVQVRGSVPVYWFHPEGWAPKKPEIVLGGSDPSFEATKKHFSELIEDFGTPIVVLNLLKEERKSAREATLSREFKKALRALVAELAQDNQLLIYDFFDLRSSKREAWNGLVSIAEKYFDETKFFQNTQRGVMLQHGVIRSNCVDCIDRTNFGQFFLGLHALGHQLVSLGVIQCPTELYNSPECPDGLLKLYLLVGDAISILYTGSPQVGSGLLNRGLAWDNRQGIRRAMSNYMSDQAKQRETNLFLGLYEPCPSHPGEMTLPPKVPEEGTFAWIFGQNLEPLPPNRVIDINELESDYYLHVRTLATVDIPKPTEPWWAAALGKWEAKTDLDILMKMALPLSKDTTFVHCGNDGMMRRTSVLDFENAIRDTWYAMRITVLDASDSEPDEEMELSELELNATPKRDSLLSLDHTALLPEEALPRVFMCDEPEKLRKISKGPQYGVSAEISPDPLYYAFEVQISDIAANRESFLEFETKDPSLLAPRNRHLAHGICRTFEHGHPQRWSHNTVMQVLQQLDVDSYTQFAIGQSPFSGQDFLKVEDDRLGDYFFHKALPRVKQFAALLRELHAKQTKPSDLANRLEMPVVELSLPFELTDSQEDLCVPEFCSRLQPFCTKRINPATIEDVVVHWVRCMCDCANGIRLHTKVRYKVNEKLILPRSRKESQVPASITLRKVTFAHEAAKWFSANSELLGLNLHRMLEWQRSQRAAQFLQLCVDWGLIRRVKWEFQEQFGILYDRCDDIEETRDELISLSPSIKKNALNIWKRKSGDSNGPPLRSVVTVRRDPIDVSLDLAEQAFKLLKQFEEGVEDSKYGAAIPSSVLATMRLRANELAYLDIMELHNEKRLCFVINVFNTLYIHAWLDSKRQAIDYSQFLHHQVYNIAGSMYSLADLKHGILRRNKRAPGSILPQFLKRDQRQRLEIPANVVDNPVSILFALIDAYVTPPRLLEKVLDDREGDTVGSSSAAPAGAASMRDSDVESDEEEEEDTPKASETKVSMLTTFQTAVLGKTKSKIPLSTSHPCVPMHPIDFRIVLREIENSFYTTFADQVSSSGSAPKLCAVFIGLDEMGKTAKEVTQGIQRMARAKKRAGMGGGGGGDHYSPTDRTGWLSKTPSMLHLKE